MISNIPDWIGAVVAVVGIGGAGVGAYSTLSSDVNIVEVRVERLLEVSEANSTTIVALSKMQAVEDVKRGHVEDSLDKLTDELRQVNKHLHEMRTTPNK